MRRLIVAVVTTAVLGGSACGDDRDLAPIPGPGPGPARTDVDTPDLRALKQEAGVEPCVPGPGGGALPAVTLPCLGGGESVDLSTLKGPLVLSFWAAWCDPCEVEMPVLQEFHEAYGDRVPILGIDYNDSFPGTALEQVRDRQVTYPSLADPGGDLQAQESFARVGRGLPYVVLVDADGAVAYELSGGVTSTAQLVDLVRDHLGVEL